MEKLGPKPAPVALTDDVAEMADYVRTTEGREAIKAGLLDIQEGRSLEGRGRSLPNSNDALTSADAHSSFLAMRSVVYAASFVDEADAIASHIESLFGLARADQFRNDLERFCEALADTPGRGKTDHGYRTPLLGVVFERNWVFFLLDDEAAHFLHLVQSRRLKRPIKF